MNAIKNRTNTHRFEASHRAMSAKLGIATALVACAGCTVAPAGEPASASAPPGAASPGAPAAASSGAPGAATVSIQGIAQASDGSPVAGVAVCLRPDGTTTDHASCTTSESSGAWKLSGAPSHSLVAITFIKTGFFPTLRPIATATSDLTLPSGDGALIASGDVESVMGGPMDPESGHVVFSTGTPGTRPLAPATVTLFVYNMLGGYHATPVYLDANGAPALGADSGTSGVFANVPPGDYVVRFFGASTACSNIGGQYGYPFELPTPDGQARLLVPVVAGFITSPVAASCSPVT